MPPEIGADPVGLDPADLDILNGGDGAPKPGSEDPPTPPAGEGEEAPDPEVGEEAEDDVEDPNKPPKDDKEEEEEEEETEEEKEERVRNERSEPELVRKIKAESPDFFKKYPEVRRALFQSRQFGEIFESVDAAKEAAEKVTMFDEFDKELTAGNSETLLKSLANTGTETFEKFAENILPSIEKFSPSLIGKITFPYVTRLFNNALEDAKASGNKNLEHGIGWMARYLWGKPEIPGVSVKPPKEADPEVARLQQETNDLRRERAVEFNDLVMNDGLKAFRTSVEQTFKGEARFTPIEKRALIEEIVDKTRKALDRDQRHGKIMQSHWKSASSRGHSKAYVPKVVNAFLGGAKSQMPAIRAKVVSAALREKGIAEAPKGGVPGTPRGGGPVVPGSKVVSSKNIDYRRTSDADILNDKITLRK